MKFNLPAAKVEWQKFIDLKTAKGMSHAEAVRAVAKAHPALRARLIAEANRPTEGNRR